MAIIKAKYYLILSSNQTLINIEYRKDPLVIFEKMKPRDNKMYYISESFNLDNVKPKRIHSNAKSIQRVAKSSAGTEFTRY